MTRQNQFLRLKTLATLVLSTKECDITQVRCRCYPWRKKQNLSGSCTCGKRAIFSMPILTVFPAVFSQCFWENIPMFLEKSPVLFEKNPNCPYIGWKIQTDSLRPVETTLFLERGSSCVIPHLRTKIDARKLTIDCQHTIQMNSLIIRRP